MKKREIKFRAWDIEGKRMYNFDFDEIIQQGHVKYCEILDGELMQFTGLLDKNGKEIYVGDVLREFRIKSAPMANNGIDRKFTVEDIRDLDFCPDQCTIIGNIYENSELKRTNL